MVDTVGVVWLVLSGSSGAVVGIVGVVWSGEALAFCCLVLSKLEVVECRLEKFCLSNCQIKASCLVVLRALNSWFLQSTQYRVLLYFLFSLSAVIFKCLSFKYTIMQNGVWFMDGLNSWGCLVRNPIAAVRKTKRTNSFVSSEFFHLYSHVIWLYYCI